MEALRLNALALHLGVDVTELNVSSYDEKTVEYGNQEYLVVTDDEAEELWEQDLENYLEECIYPEIPEIARNYFDAESWKRDARYDGRAHSLARYDGNEEYITVYYNDGGTFFADDSTVETTEQQEFYIYRTN